MVVEGARSRRDRKTEGTGGNQTRSRPPISRGVGLRQTFVPSFVVNGRYFGRSCDAINHSDRRRHRRRADSSYKVFQVVRSALVRVSYTPVRLCATGQIQISIIESADRGIPQRAIRPC